MIQTCLTNQLKFRFVLMDSQFVATENFEFIAWHKKEFIVALKENAALAKSPTKTIKTQANHVFMAKYLVFKLECLKIKHALNHFALRTKLLFKANRMAF